MKSLLIPAVITSILSGCAAAPKTKLAPAISARAAIERERVVALELVAKENVSQSTLGYLSELVRDTTSHLPKERYSVITKDNISIMLPPEKTLEDCEADCAVQTAREVGAHWVIKGEDVAIEARKPDANRGTNPSPSPKRHRTDPTLFPSSTRPKASESSVAKLTIEWRKHSEDESPCPNTYRNFISGGNLYATSKFTYSSAGGHIVLNRDFPILQALKNTYKARLRPEGHAILEDLIEKIFRERIGSALYGIMALRKEKLMNKEELSKPESLTQHFLSVYDVLPRIDRAMKGTPLKAYVIKGGNT